MSGTSAETLRSTPQKRDVRLQNESTRIKQTLLRCFPEVFLVRPELFSSQALRFGHGSNPANGGNGMTENELKFPEWQEPLREAILERDPKRLAEKTQTIEAQIRERLQQLRTDAETRNPSLTVEEQALLDALNVIRIVLK